MIAIYEKLNKNGFTILIYTTKNYVSTS